jgi:hypothetical protein
MNVRSGCPASANSAEFSLANGKHNSTGEIPRAILFSSSQCALSCGTEGLNYHATSVLHRTLRAMSFGFGIGDIIQVGNLARTVYQALRNAPVLFQQFGQDFALTAHILDELHDQWPELAQRTGDSQLGHASSGSSVLHHTIVGIREGLEELQRELGRYGVAGDDGPPNRPSRSPMSRLQFSGQLSELRQRLQFHMASLQLVQQSLSLRQSDRIATAIENVRAAQ